MLHLSRRELITRIVLPGALPQILVGLRQSLGVAWLALVVAEQINANAGLGFMISQATQFLRNDVIIVALLVYCILGLLTDWLVRLLETEGADVASRSSWQPVTGQPRRVRRPSGAGGPGPGSRPVVRRPTWCWTTSTWTSRRASSSR